MKLIVALLVLLSYGCASWIPPAIQRHDNGSITLSTSGNSFASKENMKAKLDKKAEKLCEGRGYTYIDRGTGGWGREPNYVTGSYNSYQTLKITIVCKPSSP